MGAAARESGVVLAEAFMYRHHPQTLKVKELVDAGAIGPVRFVRGTFSFPLTRPDDVRLRPEWGGGCLWDVGCYPLSFTRFLLGNEPVEVAGAQALGPTGIDETFAGQLVFPGGVLAQLDAGFRSPFRDGAGDRRHRRARSSCGSPWKPAPDLPILADPGRASTEEIAVGGTTATCWRSRTSPTASARAASRGSPSPRAAATWPRSWPS